MKRIWNWVGATNESCSYDKADEANGFVMNGVELPEEIITIILSHVRAKQLLNCKLVCKKWNDIIKSHHLWRLKLSDSKVPVKNGVPWYAYYCALSSDMFNKNLLKNGNGENGFKHWQIYSNGGDRWIVEATPCGAHLLPEHQPEFSGSGKCFATSFGNCGKCQIIDLTKKPLVMKVVSELQPKIYISEWYTGRFDCGCKYILTVRLLDRKGNEVFRKTETRILEQFTDPPWEKVEIICENYGPGVAKIIFSHEGVDTQFWKGHYGSKMAGGVVKIIFE